MSVSDASIPTTVHPNRSTLIPLAPPRSLTLGHRIQKEGPKPNHWSPGPTAPYSPYEFVLVRAPQRVAPDRASGDHVTGLLDGALYLLLFVPAARKRYGDHAGGWSCLGLGDGLQLLQNALETFEGRDILLRRFGYVKVDVWHGSTSSHLRAGAPLRGYPGPVGYYCPLLPRHNAPRLTQPPDPVPKKLALLVVQQLVVEAVGSFAQDGPQALGFQYTGVGHRAASLWSGASGPAGPTL